GKSRHFWRIPPRFSTPRTIGCCGKSSSASALSISASIAGWTLAETWSCSRPMPRCWCMSRTTTSLTRPRSSFASNRPSTGCCGNSRWWASRAFSSEVETGSRQENASNQESRAPFRFNRNGKGSRAREFVRSSGGAPVRLTNRQLNANNQFVGLAVVQRQLAAMRQHNGACDRKPETEARGFIHIPGVVATHERLEHDILARIGNAGTVVFDLDRHRVRQDSEADRGFRAEPDGVLDQVGYAAMQIVGPHRSHRVFGA